MLHIQALSEMAVRKTQPFDVPELIVLDEDDLRALPSLSATALHRSQP